MKLHPVELAEHGYKLQDVLVHQDLIPFVRLYLKKPTRSARLYTLFNLLFFGIWVSLIIYGYRIKGLDWGMALNYSFYGMGIALLLVPLHEYIHVLAYKYVGAQHTSYDSNWKKFYFMAIADEFVADRREFRIVAMAPFVVVTLLGLIAFLITPGYWQFVPVATILVHSAFCSGDFGLLSYFDFHQSKDVVTYDNVAEGRSYFLIKDKRN